MYDSTCFGRPHAHRQELNNCSSSLWFYCWSDVVTVLLVVVGPAGRPDYDQQHCYHRAPTVKPEAATAVVELLTMSVKTPETYWAVRTSKCQVREKLEKLLHLVGWFIWKVWWYTDLQTLNFKYILLYSVRTCEGHNHNTVQSNFKIFAALACHPA